MYLQELPEVLLTWECLLPQPRGKFLLSQTLLGMDRSLNGPLPFVKPLLDNLYKENTRCSAEMSWRGHVITSLKSLSLKAVTLGARASVCVRGDTVQSPIMDFQSPRYIFISRFPAAPEKDARQFPHQTSEALHDLTSPLAAFPDALLVSALPRVLLRANEASRTLMGQPTRWSWCALGPETVYNLVQGLTNPQDKHLPTLSFWSLL